MRLDGLNKRKISRAMSAKSRSTAKCLEQALVFAALGDKTRLFLVAKLSAGSPLSISELTEGSELTRQAITKHLRVLEGAGFVHRVRSGRECLFRLDTRPFNDIKEYLGFVSDQWDQALSRLKAFVES